MPYNYATTTNAGPSTEDVRQLSITVASGMTAITEQLVMSNLTDSSTSIIIPKVKYRSWVGRWGIYGNGGNTGSASNLSYNDSSWQLTTNASTTSCQHDWITTTDDWGATNYWGTADSIVWAVNGGRPTWVTGTGTPAVWAPSERYTEARERAKGLLIQHLTPGQQKDYIEHGFFHVTTQKKHRYRIRQGQIGNVLRLNKRGRPVRAFCIHPVGGLPDEDAMLAQKLLLENDEEQFLRVANHRKVKTRAFLTPFGGAATVPARRRGVA